MGGVHGTLREMAEETVRKRAEHTARRRVDARILARQRMLRRRRRVVLLLVLVAAGGVVGADVLHGGTGDPPDVVAAAATHGARAHHADPAAHHRTPSPAASSSNRVQQVTYPRDGSGAFVTASGRSKVYGSSGKLWRFQVKVERDIKHVDLAAFADRVTSILGNPQGWTAGHTVRFQRVGRGDAHDFVLRLVTAGTRDTMCHDVPEGYTSCRYEANVMINVSRWVHGVPYYDDMTAYRQYAVSHEVGHELGHDHERCPGKGKRAPTMMQQTLGMHGCVPQPWPYPHGKRYAGPAGDYSQAHIPSDPDSYYTH